MKSITVAMLTNGPGELWGWCRPLSAEMSRRGWNVHLHLLKCPFATGREREVASLISGVESVDGPSGLKGFFCEMFGDRCDVVVQMGGDLLFGRFMAAFHKVPLACYSYGLKKGLARCDLKATAFSGMARSMGDSIELVGDLVSDGLDMDVGGASPWDGQSGKKILFFPGSRPWIRDIARKYLTETVAALTGMGDFQVASILSPFSLEEEVEMWKSSGLNPFTGSTGSALEEADLAVTQPGTNTLELLHAAVPSVVAIPFDFLRSIPLSGVKGWLFSLPGGAFVKEKALRRAARKRGFVAWPNRLADREIMPELVGDISPVELARFIFDVLEDENGLDVQRSRLRDLRLRQGKEFPSVIFCDLIERLVST